MPILRTTRDVEITTAIYERVPVLVNEQTGENPWGVSFRQGLFNMTSDSHLFRTRLELEVAGYALRADGRFRRPDTGNSRNGLSGTSGETWLSLYEAKLIHQYDHRFATYETDGRTRDVTLNEHADPNFVITPRYWVSKEEVMRALKRPFEGRTYLGFRLMLRSTDAHSAMFAVLPTPAIGHSAALLSTEADPPVTSCLMAGMNTFITEYVIRNKLGGANLSFFIVEQLPVLPPETYTPELLDLIVPRVLELTYTAHDLAPFARDCGYDGPPFIWDEERRAHLRAELDGIYARLFGLSRDDFAYILDTFPIVRRNDEAKYGEFRTKRLCLEAYDYLSPEALQALEAEVKRIEVALRTMILKALGDRPDVLPPNTKDKLIAEYGKQRRTPAASNGQPSLSDLLQASYVMDLGKIMTASENWPAFEWQFASSKKELDRAFYYLSEVRNALAHNRSMPEETRKKGEQVVRWFNQVLGLT
jgi:hypothetical protein